MRSLEATFEALSDPTRRSMVERLRRGPACVSDLASPYPVSLNAISKHIKVLERAGLVRRTREGRRHQLKLDAAPLRSIARWALSYEQFWNQHLDQLEDVLAKRRRRT
jgi:DNA-binding transcriptional ArsR family regulator